MFREAADIAYQFKWSRTEILSMTKKERREWLSEIDRIHKDEVDKKEIGMTNEIEKILTVKSEFDAKQEGGGW